MYAIRGLVLLSFINLREQSGRVVARVKKSRPGTATGAQGKVIPDIRVDWSISGGSQGNA
jgi:hypothetical protein